MVFFQSFRISALNLVFSAGILFLLAVSAAQADVERFVGEYSGQAQMQDASGHEETRDLSVTISEYKKGFQVQWESVTHKSDGRKKTKAYSVDFQPSDRDGIYSAAMQRNVFGHAVPLDPMKGEPFVWGRIVGDTLTVFSLFVDQNGDYELQQFDRTLNDGGLQLEFQSVRNGEPQRTVSAFLKRN
ncbi:hypothetical protein QEZ52_11980 [Aliisedimentitalea scapharcae]|uniref:Uncharacterized protein n=1 Tax=Aliisedimentitalea scapharcae TaxID=1524259 RepID=A0ABZ2XYN4_9RHOB